MGKRVVLKCAQCGHTEEILVGDLPRYGARVRCGACGSMFPFPVRRGAIGASSTSDETTGEVPEGDRAVESAPARGEARRLLEMWVREVGRASGSTPDPATLFSRYGHELARIYDLWRSSFPAPQARSIFRRDLLRLLSSLEQGAASKEPKSP